MPIYGHTKILNISAPEWIFDLIFSTPPLFWTRKIAINITASHCDQFWQYRKCAIYSSILQ